MIYHVSPVSLSPFAEFNFLQSRKFFSSPLVYFVNNQGLISRYVLDNVWELKVLDKVVYIRNAWCYTCDSYNSTEAKTWALGGTFSYAIQSYILLPYRIWSCEYIFGKANTDYKDYYRCFIHSHLQKSIGS